MAQRHPVGPVEPGESDEMKGSSPDKPCLGKAWKTVPYHQNCLKGAGHHDSYDSSLDRDVFIIAYDTIVNIGTYGSYSEWCGESMD